jgi:hypothetical protein
MTGYREHGFDPNAFEQPGPPLKPYNWVQWTGVAIGTVGAALITLDLLARIGWAPQWIDAPSPVPFSLLVIGMVLINSRRAPGTQVGSEQLAKNRKVLLITVAICAAILGAALVIEFSGAK